MTELNIIKVLFSLMTLFILVCGISINLVEKYLPPFIVCAFRYGKFAYKGKYKSFIKPIEVPKSWFKHFYVVSSLLSLTALWFVFGSYVLNSQVPLWLRDMVDFIGNHSQSTEKAGTTLLAVFLITLQSLRRFYDTHFVSVFGTKSLMNLSHYLVGFTHYFGSVFAILIEAPNFSLNTNKVYYFRWNDLHQKDIAASILFLWAWYNQYKATVILANLRKNSAGKVVSDEHHMPEGAWFKYVSSPHLLAEILMYFSISIILWNNVTWKYIFAWVLSNQVETALLSHWWYKETFPKYPAERKAVFPFIL